MAVAVYICVSGKQLQNVQNVEDCRTWETVRNGSITPTTYISVVLED